ncbi:MAG: HAMP domain-containing protein [Gemmatimonadetes bacterium]|nr:HAMP domain-containing protein [Gemmatimonadota bacterium]NIO31130.1 HAMP domain-containing protein [Gemmatimonadota bacterium]
MSFRTKLLALFAVLGVTPVVVLGVFNYIRSMEAVESLIAARTASIAERAATEIAERYTLRQSDLLLLAENAETQRLFRARAAGDEELVASAYEMADAYLRRAWGVMASSYRWIEFRDNTGALLYSLGVSASQRAMGEEYGGAELQDEIRVNQPIRDIEGTGDFGTLVAAVRTRALIPDEALAASFGRAGYSVILDRAGERVLFHPRRAFLRQDTEVLIGPANWNADPALFSDSAGNFSYEEDGAERVASFVSLTSPPWTIVSSASVDEFAAPFARTRLVNLSLMFLVAAVISVAFLLVTRRMTRSLRSLTAAADQVAEGNFEPALPGAGSDEVGKLSAAFAIMVDHVRDMLRRIQESRHLAVVGQFASQLSHEIRNPLTSIKLNLQSLQRDAAAGRIPEDSARPVDICLREVSRLDRVVRGVLDVARTRTATREPCSVHAAVADALEVLRAQVEQQSIDVREDLRASHDTVRGDAEQLKGVLLNLLLNAAEAMPAGGRLWVSTETRDAAETGASVIRVRVADEGPGVSPELKEKIFEPFFSTKAEGVGFGLALAQHAVEEHDGTLTVEDGAGTGAVFVVELPLAATGIGS